MKLADFVWFYIVAGNITTFLYLLTLYIIDRKVFEDKVYPFLDQFGPAATVLALMLIVVVWPAAFIEMTYNLFGAILIKLNENKKKKDF